MKQNIQNTLEIFSLAVFLIFFLTPGLFAGVPVVSDLVVSDVTPRSFSVIWNTSEPAVPDIDVFSDESGLTPVSGIVVTPFPLKNENVSVRDAARTAGVMKVEVTGLTAGTLYYFQTRTTSVSTGETTQSPQAAVMMSVTTEGKITRSITLASSENYFSNDLIFIGCYLPDDISYADGALLVAEIQGGSYPISGFVGDGMAAPFAYVDLNNVFSATTHETLPLDGNENVTLTKYMGINGKQTVPYITPENDQLAELKQPEIKKCEGDFDEDGDTDGGDIAILISEFGICVSNCLCDSEPDGDVDEDDLEQFALKFGAVNCQ